MAEGNSVGGRYGIWGINPVTPSPFEIGLGAAKNVGGIFTQLGENKERNLKNQAAQMQLPYIGREKEALLAKNQADIDEAKARSGLYGAQGQEALGRLGLTNQQIQLGRQKMPYEVQEAMGKAISDPMASRALQLQFLKRNNPAAYQSIMEYGATPGAQGTPQGSLGAPQSGSAQNYMLYGNPYGPESKEDLKNESDQYRVDQNTANELSKEADVANGDLEKFKSNYDKATLKGPLLGHTPQRFSPGYEQSADTASNDLQLQMAKLLKLGRITNYEIKLIGGTKPGRTNTQYTADQLYNFMKVKNERIKEEPAFNIAAKNAGIDSATRNALWNKYNDQRPVYDIDNNSRFKFGNSWHDYLTPQAINAIKSGQDYLPVPKQINSEKEFDNWFNTLTDSDKAIYLQQHPRSK